ncbi:glycosyltransferase family 2 protein [Leifsonia sp. P73]|uniref:glycosyltransferase family 2 protein n=1 Tax=Leifsonia sp. P73 TaxID=3423959 RepID=UPI003DA31C8C
MNDEAITVIITARNAERTIATAIRSILSSLPDSGRVLVRSDGSVDGTKSVARRVPDRRVEVLEDETGLGIARSCNLLLDRVDTPLLSRMDADDISLPGRFAAQLRRLRRGVDFSFTTGVEWREGSAIVRPQKPYAISPASAPYILLLTNPFMQPTMLARTDAVRALDGWRSDIASEDFDLYLRAASAGHRIERLRFPRMIYRRTPTQTTAQPSWWQARSANPLVQQSFDELAERSLGFVPRWFEWRRAGFPPDQTPAGVTGDIRRFAATIAGLRPAERGPLMRRLNRMSRIAAAAGSSAGVAR